MEKILLKEKLQIFLDDLKKRYDVVGPTKKGGGTSSYSYAIFGPIESMEDLDIKYKFSMLSPKIIFFPDNQAFYKYQKKGESVHLQDARGIWNKKKVVLGMHPCDISALACLDKILLEEGVEDTSYRERRNKSLIIGMTCPETRGSCFCSVIGSGPDIEKGYDVLMTDLGDRYFFRAKTGAGEQLVSSEYFSKVTDEERKQRELQIEKIRNALPQNIVLEKVLDRLPEKYDDDLWDEFSEMCLTCGACNMVCPTCHCFAMNYRTNWDRTEGTRVLVWDSCHFERFARMAGDMDIRKGKSSRFKHRLYDKFYYDVRRSGIAFCVGCGRCLEFCPSHIDIRDALTKVQEA
jgi:sulfhydrogenase subunit beta (sulfur reductase)